MTNVRTAYEWLVQSNRTVILTGAGMSTESGIPDFRSPSGWWKNIDPHTVATTTALDVNYDLFHEFYTMRITALENCLPHEGHFILADWENRGLLQLIATQNVDGFHSKAGNNLVEELHGSIHTFRCHQCNNKATKVSFIEKEGCSNCGGKLRPNVVLFGENLPEESWIHTLNDIEHAELVIVIGTSLEVYPVNQLPTMTSGKTIYLNKEISANAHYFDLTIEGTAKQVLKEIHQLL